jgi:hypothetical protein
VVAGVCSADRLLKATVADIARNWMSPANVYRFFDFEEGDPEGVARVLMGEVGSSATHRQHARPAASRPARA